MRGRGEGARGERAGRVRQPPGRPYPGEGSGERGDFDIGARSQASPSALSASPIRRQQGLGLGRKEHTNGAFGYKFSPPHHHDPPLPRPPK